MDNFDEFLEEYIEIFESFLEVLFDDIVYEVDEEVLIVEVIDDIELFMFLELDIDFLYY